MVDGDEFLIELVKERSALWNKEHEDYKNVEFKKFLWSEIASKIGSEKEFLRRRWTNLREKFVRVLRYNEVYADNFKHYSSMLFLKKHIHLRGVSNISEPEPEQSDTHHFVYIDDDPDDRELMNPKIEITEETTSQDESNDELEDFEFTITEEHINQNSDSEEVLFVELKSDEDETNQVPDSSNKKRKMRTADSNISSTVEVPIKKSRSIVTVDESISNSTTSTGDRHFNDSHHATTTHCLENRCEDQIFGELVTAMLLKMDADLKRKAKKEIMNVLLQ